jgi:hypothetical protein
METDLHITNGARGEIVGIVLHQDELPLGDESAVTLKCLPAYILVKLHQTRTTKLEGLDDNVIPIETATRSFQIKVRGNGGTYLTRTVCHQQFPMTPAYCLLIIIPRAKAYSTSLLILPHHQLVHSAYSTCMSHFHTVQGSPVCDYCETSTMSCSKSHTTLHSCKKMISWKGKIKL